MDRITNKHLEALVSRINRMTGSPEAAYVKQGDRYVAQVGNYHLDHAYGGVKLVRMVNDAGGVTCPLGYGNSTKRELYGLLHAFICGLQADRTEITQ